MTAKANLPLFVLWFLMIAVSPGWGVEVGEPAPDFAIRTFDGADLSLSVLMGKPLMLIFWNTWCSDCKKELPKISRLAQRMGPRGVQMLAINTGMNDSENKALIYWKKHGYAFPVAFDQDFEIGKAFQVRGVPTILLIDSQGVVRYKGSRLPADIEERIK